MELQLALSPFHLGAAHLIPRGGGFVNFRKKLSGFHLLKNKLSGSHVVSKKKYLDQEGQQILWPDLSL